MTSFFFFFFFFRAISFCTLFCLRSDSGCGVLIYKAQGKEVFLSGRGLGRSNCNGWHLGVLLCVCFSCVSDWRKNSKSGNKDGTNQGRVKGTLMFCVFDKDLRPLYTASQRFFPCKEGLFNNWRVFFSRFYFFFLVDFSRRASDLCQATYASILCYTLQTMA